MKRVAIDDVVLADGSTSIAVASTATVYTKAFKLAYAEYFSLFYKATSDGTVNAKLEIEECWELPSTEGSQDDDFVVPEGMSIIDTVTDETQHCKSLSPIVAEYARLKITGLAGNDASTTFRIRLGHQEDW